MWPRAAPIRWVPTGSTAAPISAAVPDGGTTRPAAVRRRRRREASPHDPARPTAEPHTALLACARARRGAGTGLRLARPRRVDPGAGLRYDAAAILLDPYGVAVTVLVAYDRMAGARPGRIPRTAMKSVVADLSANDWEGDVPLGRPFARTVIYELHVRGLHSPSQQRGGSAWPAPMPVWWPRFPICGRWESLRWS